MLPAGWSFVQLQDLQKMFHFTEVVKKNTFLFYYLNNKIKKT